MEELIQYASNMGFPIVLSIYLLVRFENKMELLSKSILSLVHAIEQYYTK